MSICSSLYLHLFMAWRRIPVPAAYERPQFVTIGSLRLLGLCAVIVAIGMVPGRLSSSEAGWIGWSGIAVLGAGLAASLLVGLRRLATRLPFADAILLAIRHAGLIGLGAAFFPLWTFVYLTLWWRHPAEAFEGIGHAPRFADFFYYAVTTAFISPPGDIVAHSRGARSATMIEMLTGLALLAAYVGAFVDWRGGPREHKED
jgi:hypothetical protein